MECYIRHKTSKIGEHFLVFINVPSHITGDRMRWKVATGITLTVAIILSVLYYREINCRNSFIFYGENEKWRATYTEVKKGNMYYDSFSLEYKNARDKNGNLTEEVKKVRLKSYTLDGQVLLGGGYPKDFTGNYDIHLFQEGTKDSPGQDLNKVYSLNLQIIADSGWDTLTLERADIKVYSSE